MNLHHITRSTINAVTKDQPLTLYRATGKFTRSDDLETVPEVLEGVEVRGQVQSLSADAILQSEKITDGTVVRRCYLYADKAKDARPWALWRPLGRAGDYLTDADGAQWYVDAVLEDFSAEGWVSLQIILQQSPVTFSIKASDGDS
jgi:hypothetical protein